MNEEYARFCLETKFGQTVEIGNVTLRDAKESARKGSESGRFYNVDYFTWDGEEMELN